MAGLRGVPALTGRRRWRSAAPVDCGGSYFDARAIQGAASSFFDPFSMAWGWRGKLRTIDRRANRAISCETLRRVAEKAWLINACILNTQRKIKPFLKQATGKNVRGFVVRKKGADVSEMDGRGKKTAEEAASFMSRCGRSDDMERDSLIKYGMKITRDLMTIDLAATEIAYGGDGMAEAFFAVDAATVEKVAPNQDNPDGIRWAQVIDSIPRTFYPEGSMIVDFMNPRTDIRHSTYGYSAVEQAVDLVTSHINAFCYNAGFFTENKLPKGMLLVDGDPSQDTVEMMEDYIADIMSGGTSAQWRVPIMPSGADGAGIKWVSLAGSNREMEFQQWLDFLTSGIVCLFGCSMEELGLQSAKSQAIFERNSAPYIEASKSLVLGDTLSFLQDYLSKILERAFPGWELEFTGYEKEDQKQAVDVLKAEMESYKTVNEARADRGLPALKGGWADECPANPQLMQMYQAEKGMDGGSEGMGGGEYDGGMEGEHDDGPVVKSIDVW